VVNFILKKTRPTPSSKATYNTPQKSSSGSQQHRHLQRLGRSGNRRLQHLLLSASHDESKAMYASERDFSKSGVIPFWDNGKKYNLYQLSSNSIPGNATVKYKTCRRRHQQIVRS
jgi:iron complex outermembrane receptor protein